LEIDGHIAGCVALYPYPEEQIGELACLYVSRSNENQGLGRKLMSFVENLARQRGFSRLFALSTQAFVYLEQKGGFVEVGPEVLPPRRREKYEASGRNSRILIKDLQANPDIPAALVTPQLSIGDQWLVTRNG
jgi:amino-acid N-acetyltransferase